MNEVNAIEQEKINKEENEKLTIKIIVNVNFSLIKKANNNETTTTTLSQKKYESSIANYVKVHTLYSPSIEIGELPDKIYNAEYDIDCSDLYFNENGQCVDSIGCYLKIHEACFSIYFYISQLSIPYDANVQVLINVLGDEPIYDLIWGFSFLADALCDYNIEDTELEGLIIEDYEPFFLEYIEKGWDVRVAHISIAEIGMLFEIDDYNNVVEEGNLGDSKIDKENKEHKNTKIAKQEENKTNTDSSILKEGVTNNNNTAIEGKNVRDSKIDNENIEHKNTKIAKQEENKTNTDSSVLKEGVTNNNTAIEGKNIRDSKIGNENIEHQKNEILAQGNETGTDGFVLKGHVIKYGLSDFYSYKLSSIEELVSFLPPFGAIHTINRIFGWDKIEEQVRHNIFNALIAYYNGDTSKGNNYLKSAGQDALELTHKRLEVLSFFPGIGTVTSIVDAGLYAIEENVVFFSGGSWEEVENLRNKAAWSLVGAIPFFKICKKGCAIIKGKKLVEESKAIYKSAEKAYKVAKEELHTVKDCVKKIKKPKQKAKNDAKKYKRDAWYNLEQARKEYYDHFKPLIEPLGYFCYGDYSSSLKSSIKHIIKIANASNTPKDDLFQSIIFQYLDPNSMTRENIELLKH